MTDYEKFMDNLKKNSGKYMYITTSKSDDGSIKVSMCTTKADFTFYFDSKGTMMGDYDMNWRSVND